MKQVKVSYLPFNTDMVKALLDGRKAVTRRPLSNNTKRLFQAAADLGECSRFFETGQLHSHDQAYLVDFAPIKAGSLVYVRETFQGPLHQNIRSGLIHLVKDDPQLQSPDNCRYRASDNPAEFIDPASKSLSTRWTPSIFMPRWASRLTLKITNVRIERIQDISRAEAVAEGFKRPPAEGHSWAMGALHNFRFAWEQGYPGSWERNDWVWVYEFDVLHVNVDQILNEADSA